MGNLIITDEDFSFELISAINNDPTGSASLSEQTILQSLQHHSEDFSFELISAINNDPTGSASLSEQTILQSLQHHSEDFFFSFTTKKYMAPRSQAMIIG